MESVSHRVIQLEFFPGDGEGRAVGTAVKRNLVQTRPRHNGDLVAIFEGIFWIVEELGGLVRQLLYLRVVWLVEFAEPAVLDGVVEIIFEVIGCCGGLRHDSEKCPC